MSSHIKYSRLVGLLGGTALAAFAGAAFAEDAAKTNVGGTEIIRTADPSAEPSETGPTADALDDIVVVGKGQTR